MLLIILSWKRKTKKEKKESCTTNITPDTSPSYFTIDCPGTKPNYMSQCSGKIYFFIKIQISFHQLNLLPGHHHHLPTFALFKSRLPIYLTSSVPKGIHNPLGHTGIVPARSCFYLKNCKVVCLKQNLKMAFQNYLSNVSLIKFV